MQRSFIRIGLALVTLAAAIGVAASPAAAAAAIPFGRGWSGSWSYSSSTALSVRVRIPGASVVATGTDANGTRTFAVSLSDLDGSDGKCATVHWDTDSTVMQAQTCTGTITFTPPASDSALVVEVCRKAGLAHADVNCNSVPVPSSLQYPFVRAAGNGFDWAYTTPTDPNGDVNDWVANLNIGSVNLAYYGIDNLGSDRNRWIRSWLTLPDQSTTCGSGTIYDGDIPSSVAMCGGPRVVELPTVNVTSAVRAQGCVWTPRVLLPVVKNCVSVFVAVPN